MHTLDQLKRDLISLGICPGDTVLVHSSFKSMGELEGGAGGFFKAFTELLGEDGTLILPTLSFDYVTRQNPIFDIEKTPSCVGYLSEYFRTNVSGVVRSLHPTHSCAAYGKLADYIIKDHELDITPVGPNSPFAKLPNVNGKILMLGCSTNSNTSMHGVEETAEPYYLFDRKEPIEYTLINGSSLTKQIALRHNFIVNGKHLEQRYSRIVPLLADNEVSEGYILEAKSTLMSAKAVWEKGREKLLCDPDYFIE